MRIWLAALALGLAGVWTLPARAQTVVIQKNNIDRNVGFRSGNNKKMWVSHSDCAADDFFTFPVDLTGFSGKSLEVWAGTNCTELIQRQGDQATCWKLFEAFPNKTTINVKVRAQDLVAKVKPGGAGSGTLADCDNTDVATSGEAVTLFFMLLDSNDAAVASESFADTGFDILGPPAPTGISAGIGEKLLVVSWNTPTADDLVGYRVYCDASNGPGSNPAAGGAAGASSDAGSDATSDAVAASDAASDSGSDAASDSGSDAASGGSGGSSGTGGSGGSGGGSAGNPDCPSAALTPGTIPSSKYQCGSTASKVATDTTADNLQNGVTYAIAVAAYDELGNSGVLSSVACGTPQPVDDFFELYRRAGGRGGGGFCAIGQEPSSAALALLGGGLALALVRRRRRHG